MEKPETHRGNRSREERSAKKNILRKVGLQGLIGQSSSFKEIMRKIQFVADSDVNVLLCGETGVGKELFARAIHYLSRRTSKPFIPVNCGCLPSHLVENELFGHRKGAFTDARTNQVGMVAEAEGGTLFLDEVEALGLEAQSSLLRLLQEKTFRPIGQTTHDKADVRFIAASNMNLKEQVARQRFRSDLFYRFTISIEIPALRHREADISLLAQHFVEKYCAEYGKVRMPLSSGAMMKLLDYDWPGNIRELENVIQEAILFTSGSTIESEHINIAAKFETARESTEMPFSAAKKVMVEEFERRYVNQLLTRSAGNITLAAKIGQKDRRDLGRLIRKHRIEPASFKP